MRAVVVSAYGGPEMLRVVDVPEPQPGPGEVSVAVRFAGVNYTDVRNPPTPNAPLAPPRTQVLARPPPGGAAAGPVEHRAAYDRPYGP